MSKIKAFAFAALATALLCCARVAPAQISINIGVAPVCPYGYFDYAPYNCAPYGYYGPDWFVDGLFIGVGPWFHGPAHFAGHVDNRFDPHHGYKGPLPGHGAEPFNHFQGNEARDGKGHVAQADHDTGNERSLPGYQGGRGGQGGQGSQSGHNGQGGQGSQGDHGGERR